MFLKYLSRLSYIRAKRFYNTQTSTAVNGIKRDNLNEIRSLKTPPAPISDVLQGVLMLLGIKDHSWQNMKKFLGQRQVKEDIINFDAKHISPSIARQVDMLLQKKAQSFDPASISRVSIAAAPLAAWVKANLKYASVMQRVKPLQSELHAAHTELEKSEEQLRQCEVDLSKVDKNVSALKDNFAAKTREAETLKSKLEKVTTRLQGAQNLLDGLGGEYDRWEKNTSLMTQQIKSLGSETLLSGAFVVYLAKESEQSRKEVAKKWLSLISSFARFEEFRLDIVPDKDKLQWKAWGLAEDALSRENASVISIIPREKVSVRMQLKLIMHIKPLSQHNFSFFTFFRYHSSLIQKIWQQTG